MHHLGHRAVSPGDHRRAAGHRFDHHQAKGLGPVDWKEQCPGPADELLLVDVVDLTNKLHQRVARDQRLDGRLEIVSINPIDLGRYPQWQAGRRGNGDGPVQSLLRRDPTDKDQVVVRVRHKGIAVNWQPVVDRRLPVGGGQGSALMVGNRDQRNLGKHPVEFGQVDKVEPAVLGGEVRHAQPTRQRKVEVAGMKVNDVEPVGLPTDRLKLQRFRHRRIDWLLAQPQRPRHAGVQLG